MKKLQKKPLTANTSSMVNKIIVELGISPSELGTCLNVSTNTVMRWKSEKGNNSSSPDPVSEERIKTLVEFVKNDERKEFIADAFKKPIYGPTLVAGLIQTLSPAISNGTVGVEISREIIQYSREFLDMENKNNLK